MADKAVFFDRDDTLIEDPGYISSPEQVKLLPGVADALIQLRKMGYKLVVITNQSAVARGIISEVTLGKIHKRLIELLEQNGASIDNIYYCPYHPDGVVAKYRKESDMRKPGPGMFLLAAQEMGIDCSQSWAVGDTYRDVAAGRLAGCGTILIKSSINPVMKKLGDPEPDKIAINIKEVVNIIKMYDWEPLEDSHTQPAQPEPDQPEPEPVQPEPVQEVQAPPAVPPPIPIVAPAEQSYETDEPMIANWPNVEKIIEHHSEEIPAEQTQALLESAVNTTDRSIDIEKTNSLLTEVVKYLKKADREDMFEDSRITKLAGWAVQFLVLICLAMSLWFLMDSSSGQGPVQISLGYAAVLQLTAIAFYMMHGRK